MASEATLRDIPGQAQMCSDGSEWAASQWVLGVEFLSGSVTPCAEEPPYGGSVVA